jgi:hypothetical protein
MSRLRPHDRKDDNHEQINEDFSACRGGVCGRSGGLPLERRSHSQQLVRIRHRGAGHHRQAPDTDELRRRRKTDSKALRGGCLLLSKVGPQVLVVAVYDTQTRSMLGTRLRDRARKLARLAMSALGCRFNRSPQHTRRTSPLVSDAARSFWAAC